MCQREFVAAKWLWNVCGISSSEKLDLWGHLDVEGTGVEANPKDSFVRQSGSHEAAQEQRRHLGGDGRDGERRRAEDEELVHERQKHAQQQPQRPCADRQRRQARIVRLRHRQLHLLDRHFLLLFCFVSIFLTSYLHSPRPIPSHHSPLHLTPLALPP